MHLDGSARTERLWSRAKGVLASGLWSVTQGALHYPDGMFPHLAETAEGCRITDTTGRSYIEWMNAPTILGYRHPEVQAAIEAQLRTTGPLLSLLHPNETEAARQVRDLVPCADFVAFAKNGSDGLAIAVRIARAITGRLGVLICGYHGYHDWYMAAHPWCEGIPDSLRRLITQFPYNDLDALRALFEAHPDSIAAVVMEPTKHLHPEPGYLEAVRDLTLDYGSILVFDEVLTAFRLAPGGAQEVFGVRPDLACLGKSMANGMALSALTGKREVMEGIARVGHGITFRGELLSLAACRATLEVIVRNNVCGKLAEIGESIRTGFQGSCEQHGVTAELVGAPSMSTMIFEQTGRITPLGLKTLFLQELLKRGVLCNGMFFPSAAHDDAAVEETCAAMDEAMQVVRSACDQNTLKALLHVPAFHMFNEDALLEFAEESR